MKTNTTFDDIATLENELAELAPLVRQGFDRAGGPSARTEEAIRAEARRILAQRTDTTADRPASCGTASFSWPRLRVFAAAAAIALLLGGSFHLFTNRQPQNVATIENAWADENSASFANLLLDIQGLNEEGFFRPEEEAALWL